MKPYLILLAVCCLVMISCKKEKERPGKTTIVYGRFYDYANKEPYRGLKLKVGEYDSHNVWFSGPSNRLLSYLDSTVTDADGNFRMKFTTTGKGNAYFLDFLDLPSNVNVKDSGTVNGYIRQKRIDYIGRGQQFSLDVTRQYYILLPVSVHDNPFPPLMFGSVNEHNAVFSGSSNVYGRNKDTTVIIPIVKAANGLDLQFLISDTVTKRNYRQRLLLNLSIDKDTVDVAHIDLYPATFQ